MRRIWMERKNYLIAISFVIVTMIVLSCSKEEGAEPYLPADEISSAETNLIPHKETKVVSAILTFKNIDHIDYLIVSKSGGESHSERINRNELSSSYLFTYTVQPSDPDFLDRKSVV